jgi:cell division protein FtsA
VGGGTTDVALVRQGGIAGTKMLALGGRAFTKGLAERFALSFSRAEALKLAATAEELPEPVPRDALVSALAEDAKVWRRGVELMIEDLAEGELLPARIYLCGGGAELANVAEVLAQDDWWRHLPFSRQPRVVALRPSDVTGLRDGTGSLSTRQDVTPMALAHQALILDTRAGAAERAMRQAVRSMRL